jgi:transposase
MYKVSPEQKPEFTATVPGIEVKERTMTTVLGVDIAKASFDVTLLDERGSKWRHHWDNHEAGFKQLHAWVQQHTGGHVHVCMESTSVYWEALAEYLHAAGYSVSVVNPMRIKGYAMSQMRRSKTDSLDADVIADFCQTQELESWIPPTPEQRKLRALVRHLETLKKSRTQQQNRLATCRDEEVRASLSTILSAINREIERVEERIAAFFDDHPDLKEKKQLLETIKGIGKQTATRILAEMYDLAEYKNARAVAADAGVTTAHYRSGTTIRRRPKMSRMGKTAVRTALYYPAITAIQHNPLVRQLAQRLEAKGKHKRVIQVAAMRKLLHIAYGVLKNRKPFDPAYTM